VACWLRTIMCVRLFAFLAALLLASGRTATPSELAKEAVFVAQRDKYSDESIRRLEEINGKQGSLSGEQRERFATLWGAYLGEAAVRRHAPIWQAGGTLKFSDVLSPRDKVFKRLTNGEEDHRYVYYQLTFNRDK
jgi:hypothetical protein